MNKQFYVEVTQTKIKENKHISLHFWLDHYGNAYGYENKYSFSSLEEAVSIRKEMLQRAGWKIGDMFYVGDCIFMYRKCDLIYTDILERYRKVPVDES